MVHHVLIVGGGVGGHESSGDDTSGGDSEQSEDGGELEGEERNGVIITESQEDLQVSLRSFRTWLVDLWVVSCCCC